MLPIADPNGHFSESEEFLSIGIISNSRLKLIDLQDFNLLALTNTDLDPRMKIFWGSTLFDTSSRLFGSIDDRDIRWPSDSRYGSMKINERDFSSSGIFLLISTSFLDDLLHFSRLYLKSIERVQPDFQRRTNPKVPVSQHST